MKANVSNTDSMIGLRSPWVEAEVSLAPTDRGERSKTLTATIMIETFS
jgi:hypothetical protein